MRRQRRETVFDRPCTSATLARALIQSSKAGPLLTGGAQTAGRERGAHAELAAAAGCRAACVILALTCRRGALDAVDAASVHRARVGACSRGGGSVGSVGGHRDLRRLGHGHRRGPTTGEQRAEGRAAQAQWQRAAGGQGQRGLRDGVRAALTGPPLGVRRHQGSWRRSQRSPTLLIHISETREAVACPCGPRGGRADPEPRLHRRPGRHLCGWIVCKL